MSFQFSIFDELAIKAIEHVTKDLATLRTGKASVQMLDPVTVEAYGSEMKIHELASVSAPDPSLLMIKPWDTSILESIEKAIAKSGLNFNPVVDGNIIRIQVPPLTEERRKEMVRLLHQKVESGRVMLRSIRSDVKQEIEQQKGEANVSEDDIHNDLKKLNEATQKYIDKLEKMAENKENELMTL
ncbi:ribosome recycling factor [Patescibacteria group bacterium]|nr:ribosome recycling factor [Patescibacteria group bacterium]MBU1967319.1 ribosome recycling factor [Patescibacteria group bacterium]MBU2543444.1 ribosome recycling factor [Patescibacteria group bacterium]